MELKLGKMTSGELAEWFGIAKKTYTNNRDNYLEKLKWFANYQPVHGGVIITEIFNPIYSKITNQIDDELVFKEIVKCVEEQEGLASIAGIGRKLAYTHEEFSQLSASQCDKRVSNAAKRQFGEYCATPAYDLYAGPKGKRERVWAIKLSNMNEYRMLTKEEQNLWYELLEQWNCRKNGKLIEKEISAVQELAKGHLTPQQFVDIWQDINGASFYKGVVENFKTRTGYQIVFIAKYELGNFQGLRFNQSTIEQSSSYIWPEE